MLIAIGLTLLSIGILVLIYCTIPTFIYKKSAEKSSQNKNNTIYLTFDDGPDKEYTTELLDLLKTYNVKATFFVVAESAKENQHLIKRMVGEGHCIGLHSLEHRSAYFSGYRYTKNDFRDSLSIMQSINVEVTYYRPPWGHINLFTLYYARKHNLRLVLWNVMVEDWCESSTADDIKNRLIKRVKAGDIICLHDARGSNGAPRRTIKALDQVIPHMKAKNYNFELINEVNNY